MTNYAALLDVTNANSKYSTTEIASSRATERKWPTSRTSAKERRSHSLSCTSSAPLTAKNATPGNCVWSSMTRSRVSKATSPSESPLRWGYLSRHTRQRCGNDETCKLNQANAYMSVDPIFFTASTSSGTGSANSTVCQQIS